MGIPERKEREKELRRESILDSAEKLFFEKGLIATTMDEIAQEAELSKGTLYIYYKSKDDIYLSIICRGFDLLTQKLRDASSEKNTSLERLKSLGNAYYQFFEDQKNYFRMFSYLDSPQFHSMASEELLIESRKKSQQAWDVLIEVIQNGIKDGTFNKSIVPVEMAIILWLNATSIMKLKDHNDQLWLSEMKVDFKDILQKSNDMLISNMLSQKLN